MFITAGEGDEPSERWYGVSWDGDGPAWVGPEQFCEDAMDLDACLGSLG